MSPSTGDKANFNLVDVVAFGNACIDILLPSANVPSAETCKSRSALAHLAATAPREESWEVGGSCNFLIASSRIGLHCACVGHAGPDRHGVFLTEVLAEENIKFHRLISPDVPGCPESTSERTLVCFVLTDGDGNHAFCSRYDLGPWPLLGGVSEVDNIASQALSNSSAIFVNGFIFDELEDAAVRAALIMAKENGAAVFFDPGPRASMFLMDSERAGALRNILAIANVVLATLDEAKTLVNLYMRRDSRSQFDELTDASQQSSKARLLARVLLEDSRCGAEWVVIKCGPHGAAIFTKDGFEAWAGSPFVPVRDTVGCGDSAAAAIVLGYLNIERARRRDMKDTVLNYVSNSTLLDMLEETLTLATTIGAATAMGDGAGRNVATAEVVRTLLSRNDKGRKYGFRIDVDAAMRAKNLLEDSVASCK